MQGVLPGRLFLPPESIMLIGLLGPERIELWFAQERLARAIACECEPENRARWAAMAEQWAALAQIAAALICGEASVALRSNARLATRETEA
jgi:hypothetical protein